MHFLKPWIAALATLSLAAPLLAAPAYPLKPSANGRYLVDQNNVPCMIVGDSPQALMVNLSTNEAAYFFADRAGFGFNTVWVNLLCSTYTGGRADASTYDGILPFTANVPSTGSYDLTTPNEAYFARVDRMLRGITLGPKRAVPMKLRMPEGPPSPSAPVGGDIHELVSLPRA